MHCYSKERVVRLVSETLIELQMRPNVGLPQKGIETVVDL